MWEVKDCDNFVRGKSTDLAVAMEMAKYVNEFVTITNGTLEIVGMFGVDEVTDPNYNGWISRKKLHNIL